MVVVNRLKKKSVSEFLAQYNSKSTKKNYLSSLRRFFCFIYPELRELYPKTRNREEMKKSFAKLDPKMDELSLSYIQGDSDIEKEVVAYRKSMEGLAPKTISSAFAPVFRFLEVNNLEFTKDFKKNLIGKVSSRGISKERIPNPEELKRLLYNLPPHGRGMVMVIATGGMRPDEALTLKLIDLELDYVANYMGEDRQMKSVPIPKVNIRAENTKTGEARHTYITMETRVELEKWLGQARQIYIQKLKSRAHISPDESLVFPFGYDTMRTLWVTALKKSGLYEVDPRTKRVTLRLHNLRKYFRTWGGWSNPDVAEALMGHQRGMAVIYSRQDQAERLLVEGYKESEPNITLGDQVVVEAPSEDIKALKDWNRQLRTELEEWKADVTRAHQEIKTMKQELNTLKDYLQTWGDPPSPETLEKYRRLEELDAATEDTEEGILKIQEAVHQSKKQ